MDIATIVGILLGLGLIVGSIMLDGSLLAFVNIPGLLIVIGGTLAATLINQKLRYVIGAFAVAMNAFFDRGTSVESLLDSLAEMSQMARKEGALGLEKIEIRDPFLKRGADMVIDGLEVEFIQSALTRELATLQKRHERGHQIFRFMASTAPAMGMIGTLIGLVNMLQALDDPSSIGPAMAVALLTTFYGAVLAFLIFGPIGEKLEARTKEELLRGQLIIAGIESIVVGENNARLRARTDGLLEPKQRAPSEPVE